MQPACANGINGKYKKIHRNNNILVHVINRHSSHSIFTTNQVSALNNEVCLDKNFLFRAGMSTHLRKCRRSLAAALDRATEEVPCGSSSPNSVSSQNCRISQNDPCVFDHWTERPDCMCFRKEDFLWCTRSVMRDLHGILDILTLEDLVAKLEFENELNRVCSRSLQRKNPGSSLHQREGATDMEEESTDRWVHDSSEEYSFLLDTILDIERDSDFTADCDVSSLELDLQL